MAEKTSIADEAEYWRLQEAVTRIETALHFSGGLGGMMTAMLLRFVENAKQRLAKIEADVLHKAEEERETNDNQVMVIRDLVEHEKALSQSEREEYAGFLREEHFTRNDFAGLERFYSHSWDRLSDGGKRQMSHRVWEGIRHGEYRFTELPEVVKEKEAERVELLLQREGGASAEVSGIPERDRADFLKARASGDRTASYEVLNRPSFAQYLGRSHTSEAINDAAIDAAGVVKKTEDQKPGQPALEQVAVRVATDSNKITLQDIGDLDGADAKPPLPERATTSAKTR